MIDLENRFRHPNQSDPKSMDAVFVRMIGVRKKAQSVLLSTMRARCTPKYTLLSPAPTQLKKYGENCSFSFLENDAGHWERLPAENGEFVFFPLWNATTPIPTGILLSLFFWSKTSGKKLGYRPPETIPLIKTIGLLRTQTLRENDGPIGIPIDDDLRQETLLVELCFLEDTLFAMRSNAKIDQCVETTPLWNWPKQARARFNYYWQTTLCCSFPTPPWCGSFSILCQKKMGGFIQTWPLRTIAVLTCVFPVRMRYLRSE